jgi:hypothetical protein
MDVVFAYRGRRITQRELAEIRALIAAHPQASRRALSKQLCEAWQWRQPNGALRDMVCRGLMLALHRRGLIDLPALRRRPPNPLACRARPKPVAVERTSGSTLHDIYARFFGVFGLPKGAQFKVNTSTLDATVPAAVSDANSNVFIAWEEFDSATQNGKILISKYNVNGTLLAGPVQVDKNGPAATRRHEVSLAIDNSGNVIATWWEGKSDGTRPEAVFRRRLTNSLADVDTSQVAVNTPPDLPFAKRALRASVATDSSGNFGISWWANVNDQTGATGNVFTKMFNASTATILKNDFRVDLAPRTAVPLHPRIARGPAVNCYAVAWRDNRAGHYDVYTRVVTAP